jgi:hypothetical protein
LSNARSIAAASGFDGAVMSYRSNGEDRNGAREEACLAAQDLIDQGHARTVIVLGQFTPEETESVSRQMPYPHGRVHLLAKPFRNADLLTALRLGIDG